MLTSNPAFVNLLTGNEAETANLLRRTTQGTWRPCCRTISTVATLLTASPRPWPTCWPTNWATANLLTAPGADPVALLTGNALPSASLSSSSDRCANVLAVYGVADTSVLANLLNGNAAIANLLNGNRSAIANLLVNNPTRRPCWPTIRRRRQTCLSAMRPVANLLVNNPGIATLLVNNPNLATLLVNMPSVANPARQQRCPAIGNLLADMTEYLANLLATNSAVVNLLANNTILLANLLATTPATASPTC